MNSIAKWCNNKRVVVCSWTTPLHCSCDVLQYRIKSMPSAGQVQKAMSSVNSCRWTESERLLCGQLKRSGVVIFFSLHFSMIIKRTQIYLLFFSSITFFGAKRTQCNRCLDGPKDQTSSQQAAQAWSCYHVWIVNSLKREWERERERVTFPRGGLSIGGTGFHSRKSPQTAVESVWECISII